MSLRTWDGTLGARHTSLRKEVSMPSNLETCGMGLFIECPSYSERINHYYDWANAHGMGLRRPSCRMEYTMKISTLEGCDILMDTGTELKASVIPLLVICSFNRQIIVFTPFSNGIVANPIFFTYL